MIFWRKRTTEPPPPPRQHGIAADVLAEIYYRHTHASSPRTGEWQWRISRHLWPVIRDTAHNGDYLCPPDIRALNDTVLFMGVPIVWDDNPFTAVIALEPVPVLSTGETIRLT